MKPNLIKYPQLYYFIARGLAQQELKLNWAGENCTQWKNQR